eukprot:Rhum_TRINITY_DN8902_c0_g1::Rhum_TRINITY_DN8902_c0_g1_i1::g.30571::m.30571
MQSLLQRSDRLQEGPRLQTAPCDAPPKQRHDQARGPRRGIARGRHDEACQHHVRQRNAVLPKVVLRVAQQALKNNCAARRHTRLSQRHQLVLQLHTAAQQSVPLDAHPHAVAHRAPRLLLLLLLRRRERRCGGLAEALRRRQRHVGSALAACDLLLHAFAEHLHPVVEAELELGATARTHHGDHHVVGGGGGGRGDVEGRRRRTLRRRRSVARGRCASRSSRRGSSGCRGSAAAAGGGGGGSGRCSQQPGDVVGQRVRRGRSRLLCGFCRCLLRGELLRRNTGKVIRITVAVAISRHVWRDGGGGSRECRSEVPL